MTIANSYSTLNDEQRYLVNDLVRRLHYPIREAIHRVLRYGDYHNRHGFDWKLKAVWAGNPKFVPYRATDG